MPLFQKNVLKDYLENQNQKKVAKAYKSFIDYFHHNEIQCSKGNILLSYRQRR